MKKQWPLVVALFVLTCAVYANSLWNDFNLDDDTIIRNNSLIRSLSNLPKIFVSNYWANTPYEKGVLLYRPLAVASFAVDYALWGNQPFGFHLTNLLINGTNAVLLLVLLARMFGAMPGRTGPLALAFCALLYAFHPVHTEAVNMVVGRTELLAAMFGLLTFICHLNDWKAGAVLCFSLALLSKEIAITIPAMIFTYEWFFGRNLSRPGKTGRGERAEGRGQPRQARPLSSFFPLPSSLFGSGAGSLVASVFAGPAQKYLMYAGVLGLYLAIRFAVLRGFVAAHQTGILASQDPFHRLLTVLKVLGYYLKLVVAPYPLTPDYSDVPLPQSAVEPWVLLPFIGIVALLAAAWRLRQAAPGVAYAVLWLFVTLLPVSNIISIGAFLGERFLYLPSASLAFLAAGLFSLASAGRGKRAESRGQGAALRLVLPSPLFPLPSSLLGCVLVAAGFAALTFNRNFDWRSAGTLWAKVQARQPGNPRANFHLGVRAEEAKDFQQALVFYEKAIEFNPNHNWNPDRKTIAMVKERISDICYNLSLKLYNQGQLAQATDYCRRSLQNNDKNARAHVIMGNLYVQNNDFKKAVDCYETALKLDPDLFEAKENLKRVKAALQ